MLAELYLRALKPGLGRVNGDPEIESVFLEILNVQICGLDLCVGDAELGRVLDPRLE